MATHYYDGHPLVRYIYGRTNAALPEKKCREAALEMAPQVDAYIERLLAVRKL